MLHISDLHFGPPFLPRVGEALQEIAPRLTPDVIIVTGDITQRAKPSQFEAARRFIDRLPDVPKVIVPGNHDVPLYRIRERLSRPLDLYRKYMTPELDGVLRLERAVILWLNSTSPYRAISNGRIHLDQLAYSRKVLADASPETVKFIAAHHHFHPAPDYERDQTMPKAKRAMDIFVELGVDMIFGGHLHRAYIGNSLDVYAGADREHGIIIVQCGTTTSRQGRGREREKNSFNFVEVDGDLLHVTHYLYFEGEGFSPISRHTFPRPGRRVADASRLRGSLA
ncbi:metallophosphoesterase family protein [Minwuia thermotolerans]|nr:metallophosphoesterase family protein [Minwuia thermotolerans]